MTILELENLTGLDRATIRFYEKEGLITPNRKENSYRDYSVADASEIMKIKLLRQLDVPIETIRNLQQGSADITSVLRVQASALQEQITEKERAAAICKEISAAQITYKTLDAAFYLGRLKEQPKPVQTPPQPAPEQQPEQQYRYVEYHPVRRFVARMLDYTLLRILVRFVLIVVLRIRPFGDFLSNVVTYACLLASVPLQAWMLSAFATTPGKWCMGIQVLSYKGEKLSFGEAMEREWVALWYGYGGGIPFFRLWRLFKSYKTYSHREILQQDVGIEHLYSRQKLAAKSIFAVFCAFIIVISCVIALDVVKPRYRGTDITIAQFAENYNYYAEILEEDFTMNPDGTWYAAPPAQSVGGSVIIGNTTVEKQNEPLRFEIEGERITRIAYENAWNDPFMLQPVNAKMICAIFTAIMSQKDLHIMDLLEITKTMESHKYDTAVNFGIGNIEINWTIKENNCINSGGVFYPKDNEKPSRVEFSFEIVINKE